MLTYWEIDWVNKLKINGPQAFSLSKKNYKHGQETWSETISFMLELDKWMWTYGFKNI